MKAVKQLGAEHPNNVTEFLLAGKDSALTALVMLQGQYTYGQLHSASTEVAKFLIQAGGRKGDRVILASENSFFWVAAYLGILLGGLVCVPLPHNIGVDDLQHILETTEPRFAFLQAKSAAK